MMPQNICNGFHLYLFGSHHSALYVRNLSIKRIQHGILENIKLFRFLFTTDATVDINIVFSLSIERINGFLIGVDVYTPTPIPIEPKRVIKYNWVVRTNI